MYINKCIMKLNTRLNEAKENSESHEKNSKYRGQSNRNAEVVSQIGC